MLKVHNIPAGIEGTGIHPDFKSLILSGENRWQWHIINSVSALERQRSADTAVAAIERGRKIFNEMGCAGCHPRGGTIGGRARNILGKLSPRPVPDLHGAASHFPRVATGKKVLVTLGQMNDI